MRRFAILLAALCSLAPAHGDVPTRTESLVYSILAFNGRDYSETFAPETADTIYLIAGKDSFLSLRKTLVYFWPLTGELKTDTENLDEELAGTLECTGPGRERRSFEPIRYTYFNVRGEYELNWRVARGADADAEMRRWQDIVARYRAAVDEYQRRAMAYEEELAALTSRIQKLRDQGRDVTDLVDQLAELKKPQQPAPPADYVMPPAGIREAFILNLPEGTYALRMRNPDGSIMEGSEKRLVVFDRRRAQTVGYEVIPGDKWTRPVLSHTPSGILYVDGSTTLFLRPFLQDEYNDLSYQKAIRNDARGNPSLMTWVRIQQVPKAVIEARTGDAAAVTLREQPFFVEQLSGATLGYRIVPYDPQGEHQGEDPSIIAFRIPMSTDRAVIRLRTLDARGTVLPGSEREIRVPSRGPTSLLLLLTALAPLLVMAIVLVVRSRRSAP
jgi:hypothetical protein